MKIRVFTDGACSKNGQKGARASYAYYFPDHKDFSKADHVPASQPQTNQRGELMAITEAVKTMIEKFPADEIEVQIYTDSMYSKNCLTVWLPGFIERNWKTSGYKGSSGGSDVKNRDIIEETVKLLPKFKSYIISYVAAHTGNNDDLSKNNDIVDRMAVAVLNPEVAEVKIVHTNTQVAIEGLPVETNITNGSSVFANNELVEIASGFNLVTATQQFYSTFFTQNLNDTTKTISDVNWVNAFSTTPDFRLDSTSTIATGADFTNVKFEGGFLLVSEIKNEDLEIYPNPTNDYINIKSEREVTVLDGFGRVLINSNNHKIDMSNFTNGLYYVKVGNITKTFIVNK
jgi:ribonuclease HI